MKLNKFYILAIFFLFSCSKTRFEKLNSDLAPYLEKSIGIYHVQLKKIEFRNDTSTITYNLRILNSNKTAFVQKKLETDIYIKAKGSKPIYPLLKEQVSNGINNSIEYICVFNTEELYKISKPTLVYHNSDLNKTSVELQLVK